MPKPRTSYVCAACGERTSQWQGQCPSCEAWNTLEATASPVRLTGSRITTAPTPSSRTVTEITAEPDDRIVTGIGELDRVLGGGLVAGSAILLGGDPGIGKSTILLQAADALSRDRTVVYASGEESVRQIALRARRLGLASTSLRLIAETRVEALLAVADGGGGGGVVVHQVSPLTMRARK